MGKPKAPELPKDAPPELRGFIECRLTTVTVNRGTLSWLPLPKQYAWLGTPGVAFAEGKGAGQVTIKVKLVGPSVDVPASVTDGKLSVDLNDGALSLLPADIAKAISDWVAALNAWLQANGQQLGAPQVTGGSVTLTKVRVEAAAPGPGQAVRSSGASAPAATPSEDEARRRRTDQGTDAWLQMGKDAERRKWDHPAMPVGPVVDDWDPYQQEPPRPEYEDTNVPQPDLPRGSEAFPRDPPRRDREEQVADRQRIPGVAAAGLLAILAVGVVALVLTTGVLAPRAEPASPAAGVAASSGASVGPRGGAGSPPAPATGSQSPDASAAPAASAGQPGRWSFGVYFNDWDVPGIADGTGDLFEAGTGGAARIQPRVIDFTSVAVVDSRVLAGMIARLPAECGEEGLICAGDGPAAGEYVVSVMQVAEPIEPHATDFYEIGLGYYDPTPGGGASPDRMDFGPNQFATGMNTAYSIRFPPAGNAPVMFRLVYDGTFLAVQPSDAFAYHDRDLVAAFIPAAEWDGAVDWRVFGFYTVQGAADPAENFAANDVVPDIGQPMVEANPLRRIELTGE